MSLNTVTVTWNELDIGQAPLGGYVSFQLSAPAPDSADGLTIEPEPARTYFFTAGTGTSDPLVANDNAQLSAGSYYLVTVAINGQQPYTFKTLVNHANGASQTLAFLYANQAQPVAQFAQYLPLADFTALGDTLYGTGAGTVAALPGNTSLTMEVLSQTGTGTASAAPAWLKLFNDRGAIAASTAYNPGDTVAYQGQRVLITQAVTSSSWPNWFTPPTLTAGTYVPVTSQAVYYAADWGVKADGTTDNGPALNRALQFMSRGINSGGFLVLPDGYTTAGSVTGVGSTVIIPPACYITGGGIETSTIKLLSGANCDVIQFQTAGSASQAAILSAAEGNTVSSGSLRNAFYAGLMNLCVHGANTLQGASQYNYGVNMTTNPQSSKGGSDPDFDPYNYLVNVEVRSCTGDGLFHFGRGGLRVTNCLFRYNQGWGTAASFDSLYTGNNFGQNGIGGIYMPHSSCDGAANKSYNNGTNAQWASLTAYSALATVMYSGQMYRAINAVTSSTPPSTDTTNWAHITGATAPQYWGYGLVMDAATGNTWAACDGQQNSAGDYYLHSSAACIVQGTSGTPNYNQAGGTQNSSNPNGYACLTLDGSSGCTADVTFSALNSAVYVLRSINGSTRNDVRMTGDTTYQAILSADSITLVGSGNSVKVNGASVSDDVAAAFTATGLNGATAASRYAGATASGAPASGTFLKGDFVIDQSGNAWVCTVAGSPGTWTGLSGNASSIDGVTVTGTPVAGQSITALTATTANWQTPAAGVTLDTTAADIQPAGQSAAAGSKGQAADAKHVHPPGSAFLCTPTQYAPATQTALATTSATFAPVSSTNVNTGSFTAPASGSVVVTAAFAWNVQTINVFCAFGLAAHGTTTPMVGSSTIVKPPATDTKIDSLSFLVTGLTAGTSYNFDLMFAVSGAANLQILAIGQSSTTPNLANSGVGAPVVMTVQAV